MIDKQTGSQPNRQIDRQIECLTCDLRIRRSADALSSVFDSSCRSIATVDGKIHQILVRTFKGIIYHIYLAFFVVFSVKQESRYNAKLRKDSRHLTLELVPGVVGGLLDLVGCSFDVIVHFCKSANHKIQMDFVLVSVYHIT